MPNTKSFRCPRCKTILPDRQVYQQHLRSHASIDQTQVHKSAGDTSTLDDTARYIAERRKNFPTTDNINKKLKSDEERQQRGDVLETRQFGQITERKTTQITTNEVATVSTSFVRNKEYGKATLLERLLAPDIRRERNMVLQCIRHIVNQNFFELDVE